MWMQARRRGGRDSKRRNPNPWRVVAWISDAKPGRYGGRCWELILECGHYAFRRHSEPSADRPFARTRLAPFRVRCDSCGRGIPTSDPGPLIALRVAHGV